jgi:hypothetical protein
MRPPCGHWRPTLFPADHTRCTTPHSQTVLPCVDGDVRRLDCAGLRDRARWGRTRVNCFRPAVRGIRASASSHSALDQRLRARGRQLFSVVLASTLASPGNSVGGTRNDAMLIRYFPTATRDSRDVTRYLTVVARHSVVVARHSVVVARHLVVAARHLVVAARHFAVVTSHFAVVTQKSLVGTRFVSPGARQAPAIARLPFVVTDDSARDRGHASSRSSVAGI